ANITVMVSGPTLQGVRGAVSNEQGAFLLLGLPVGEYAVKFQQLAYEPRTLEHVPVRLGKATTLGDVRLEEHAIAVEGVSVSARAALVDPTSTVVGENLTADDYQALPVERDYKS